eukprot:362101-Chlamydomonas_euryale.AAC.4
MQKCSRLCNLLDAYVVVIVGINCQPEVSTLALVLELLLWPNDLTQDRVKTPNSCLVELFWPHGDTRTQDQVKTFNRFNMLDCLAGSGTNTAAAGFTASEPAAEMQVTSCSASDAVPSVGNIMQCIRGSQRLHLH